MRMAQVFLNFPRKVTEVVREVYQIQMVNSDYVARYLIEVSQLFVNWSNKR